MVAPIVMRFRWMLIAWARENERLSVIISSLTALTSSCNFASRVTSLMLAEHLHYNNFSGTLMHPLNHQLLSLWPKHQQIHPCCYTRNQEDDPVRFVSGERNGTMRRNSRSNQQQQQRLALEVDWEEPFLQRRECWVRKSLICDFCHHEALIEFGAQKRRVCDKMRWREDGDKRESHGGGEQILKSCYWVLMGTERKFKYLSWVAAWEWVGWRVAFWFRADTLLPRSTSFHHFDTLSRGHHRASLDRVSSS